MYKKFLLGLSIFIIIILGLNYSPKAQAIGTTYYFNNAVDTNPATLGNYWLNAGLTTPASVLPDLATDYLNIVSGATYNGSPSIRGSATNQGIITGNASFYDSAVNNGTVNGNGSFYEDTTENNGTVLGTKRRKYTEQTVFERDFVSDGPWVIIAVGGAVDFDGCVFDENTLYERETGGYFSGVMPLDPIADTNFIKLFYPAGIDPSSVPSVSDFSLSVNGSLVTITGIEVRSEKATLTFSSTINPGDDVRLTYSVNTVALANSQNLNVSPLSSYPIPTLTTLGLAPVYGTQVGTKLYISNNHSSSVTVIDTLTDTALYSLPVEAYPEFSVLVGNKLYVNNLQSDSVTVINTLTDTVVDTLYVGNGPYFSVVAGNKIYVSNTNTNTISVINTSTDTVTSTITVGTPPWFPAVSGSKIYVPNRDTNNVSVIDTVTDTVIATISVDNFSSGTKAIVVGDKVYVGGDTSMSVINTSTNTVEATINGLSGPYFSCVVGSKIFVPNRSNNTLSIINSSSNTIISTIAVGSQPTTCVVIGSKIYVTHNLSSQISIFDSVTNSFIENITVGAKPFYATAVGKKLFVSNNTSNNFSVIDTTTIPTQRPNLTSFSTTTADGTYAQGQAINIKANFGQSLLAGSTMTVSLNSGASVVLNNVSGSTLSGTYTIGSGQSTPDLAVTSITSASVTDSTNTYTRTSYSLPSSQAPSGGTLVAENSFITRNLGDNTNIVIGSYQAITTGPNPYQITPPITVNNIPYMYVANQGNATVSVIRKNDHVLVATIPVGDEPYGVVPVTLSGTTYVYVANTGSDDVSVIDTTTNTVIATVPVGVFPYYVTAVGSQVYATNGRSNTVSVINANTNTVTATIPVGVYPRGIKARGTDVYVANYGDPNYSGGNSVSVINSLTNTVTATIVMPAGVDGPRGVTVLGSNVYVANFRSHNVTIIDANTNTVTTTVNVGTGPRGMATVGTNVYVENFEDGTVSVLDTNTNTISSTVQVGSSPSGITASGTDLYLTRFQDNRMSILNSATGLLRSAFPVISSLGYSVITPNSAILNWSTDKATTSTLDYGTTTALGSSSSGLSATSHSRSISGLTAATTYYYRVTSVDADGNTTISPIQSFTTTTGGSGIVIHPIVPLPITPLGPITDPEPPLDSGSTNDSIISDVSPTQGPLSRLGSKILLAVEDKGRLWYEYPATLQRYEISTTNALKLFETVALGITNKNLDKIPTASSSIPPATEPPTPLSQRLKNMFLLQVENKGQTWYVDHTGIRHFVTADNLFNLSINLMNGILNKDLENIPEANK